MRPDIVLNNHKVGSHTERKILTFNFFRFQAINHSGLKSRNPARVFRHSDF